jgi:hypothetical protein
MVFDENIPGWLNVNEVNSLKEICSLVPNNSNVIQVGVFAGRDTLLLSHELSSCTIYAIDPWPDYRLLKDLQVQNGRRLRLSDVQKIFQKEVLPKCANVQTVQGMFPADLNIKENIGMCYFDTWADSNEYNLYSVAWDLLLKGGILCGRSFSYWGINVITAVRRIGREKNVCIHLPPGNSLWYIIKK